MKYHLIIKYRNILQKSGSPTLISGQGCETKYIKPKNTQTNAITKTFIKYEIFVSSSFFLFLVSEQKNAINTEITIEAM
jgi:hypothetical protein